MRLGDQRLYRVRVINKSFKICGVSITLYFFICAAGDLAEKAVRCSISGDNPIHRSRFNRHITERHSFIHVQSNHRLTVKFQCPVSTAVCGDIAENLKDQVFSGQIFRQTSFKGKFQRSRHFFPDFTGSQDKGGVRITHTGSKQTEGTGCTGM